MGSEQVKLIPLLNSSMHYNYAKKKEQLKTLVQKVAEAAQSTKQKQAADDQNRKNHERTHIGSCKNTPLSCDRSWDDPCTQNSNSFCICADQHGNYNWHSRYTK